MVKRRKCINIFVDNKINLNLYQISSAVILLIICFQISSNLIKYTQLSNYISSNSSEKITNQTVDDFNLEEDKTTSNSEIKNTGTKECTINLSEIKDLSYIIGVEKIMNIYIDSNQVKVQGFCDNIKILEEVSDRKNIRDFNINSLQKKGAYYFFDIEYKLGDNFEDDKRK